MEKLLGLKATVAEPSSPQRQMSLKEMVKQVTGLRGQARPRMIETIDMNTASELKREVAKHMESDNRTAAFNAISNAKVPKEEFFDVVMYTARALLTNNFIHECFMLLRSSHDRAVSMYGEPVNYQLVQEIGNMYNSLNQPRESIKWYEQLLDKNAAPDEEVYCNIGLCYMQVRNYPQAIEAFLKSTAANMNYTKSWMNLGQCYIRAGQVDKAIHSFQQLPESSEAYNCIGNSYHTQEKYEEAIASYLKALDLGEDPGVLNNLGCSLKALGLIEDAIVSFNDSLAAQPNGDAAQNLIVLYLELGDIKNAKTLFRSSLRIIPSEQMKKIKAFFKEVQAQEQPEGAIFGAMDLLGNMVQQRTSLQRGTVMPRGSLMPGAGQSMLPGRRGSVRPGSIMPGSIAPRRGSVRPGSIMPNSIAPTGSMGAPQRSGVHKPTLMPSYKAVK